MVLVLVLTLAVVSIMTDGSVQATSRGPILIQGDNDFTSANGVVSGSGSSSDPYIISGWEIDHNSTPAVKVEDTTKHFSLRGLTLTCTDEGSTTETIWLERVENATLLDLTILNPTASDGFIRGNSAGTILIKNITTDPPGRFQVTKVDRLTVVDASMYDIDVSLVTEVTLMRLFFDGYGISVSGTENLNVHKCNSSNNSVGLSISTVTRGNVTDCTFMDNNGADLDLWNRIGTPGDFKFRRVKMGPHGLNARGYYDIDTSNTVDGKSVYYLINRTGMRLDSGVGQVYMKGCWNIVVANLTLTTTYSGITGEDLRACTFENLTLRGAREFGMDLTGLKGCKVRNCTVYGVDISSAENLTFTDNRVFGADRVFGQHGCATIGIGGTGPTSAWILNNTLSDGERYGLYVGSTWDIVNHIVIAGGSVNNISAEGVHVKRVKGLVLRDLTVWDCELGIYMEATIDSTVSGNDVRDCVDGILSTGGRGLVIDSNTVVGCTDHGIRPTGYDRVSNNTVRDCAVGIDLTSNILYPTLVENNTVVGGVRGVEMGGVKVTLARNDVRNCSEAGIFLLSRYIVTGRRVMDCRISGCPVGIYFDGGPPTEVTRCLISNCTTGVLVYYARDLQVTDSTIEDCTGYGLEIVGWSYENQVYHNNFNRTNYDPSSGSYKGPQAYADGGSNVFNVSMEGNYWDDYLSRYPAAQTTNGRTWDIPYVLDGPKSFADSYPLVLRSDPFPPTAEAGPDVTVDQNTTVTLDGSSSRDNFGIVSMTWSLVYMGSPVSLGGETVQFTFDMPGKYVVTLEVRDAWGNVGRDGLVVTVRDTDPPVAEAGPDLTVDMHEEFVLDGRGSHDNLGIVSYTWRIDPGGLNGTAQGSWARLTMVRAGIFTVELHVADAAGNSDVDTMTLRVRDTVPPVADAGDDVEVDQGNTVTLDGYGSSDNIGIARWNWSFEYWGVTVNLTGPGPVYTFDIPGVYIVTLVVEDPFGLLGTDTVQVTVHDTEPPVASAGPDITVDQGAMVELDGTGSTDNGGVAEYRWTFGYDDDTWTLMEAVASFRFSEAGSYIVTLRVTDTEGNWAEDVVTVTVRDTEPPVARAIVPSSVDEGSTVTLDGSGSTDNVAVEGARWTFTQGGGEVTLDGLSPTYTFEEPGKVVLTLTVTDAAGNEHSVEATLEVVDTTAPVATLVPLPSTVVAGTTLTLDASASTDNLGIAEYEWRITSTGPPVVRRGVRAAYFFEKAGEYTVTLEVTDAVGNSATDSATITVRPTVGDWTIGPFTDGKGRAVTGAKVVVILNGTRHEGRTDGSGIATLRVSWHDLVPPAEVTVIKDGWVKLKFEMDLDEDRNPSGEIPAMERAAGDSPAPGTGPVVMVILTMAALVWSRRRRIGRQ